MSDENISEDLPAKGERIFYVRDIAGQPVAVVAYSADPSRGRTNYALSVLHPADKFDRSLGRRIALGRLRCGVFMRGGCGTVGTAERPLAAVLREISQDEGVPSRVRRLLRKV